MNYLDKIKTLLEENMTAKGYKLWEGINDLLPNIWGKPTSSTFKYHRKIDGRVPNIDEHVYEMLYAAVKLFSVFNINSKTPDADVVLFALVLHDSLKYGKWGTMRYVDNFHDKRAADMIRSNENTFKKLLSENQYHALEEAVRFHSGRWSTDVADKYQCDINEFSSLTFFVHMLDMMSSKDLIQTDVRNSNESNLDEACTRASALG
jgi:hypothetical protein